MRPDLAQFTAYTPHPETPVAEPTTIDRLDTNESPYDLPQDLKQKLTWQYQHQIEANRYPDGSHLLLKQAIADYVKEGLTGDAPLQAHYISVGNGSDELIRSILIATCLGGQGSILVAHPTFSMYAILAQTLGIPVVTIGRNDDFGVDLEAAQAALAVSRQPPIRVVFMVHPNSPTGNLLTPAEQNWLKNLPPDMLVVVDEAYFEFAQTTLVAEVLQRPNWVILRTFSKAFRLAAHRVGYGIAHPELVATLEKVRLPYNLPSMSQVATEMALTHRQTLLQAIPEILAERQRLSDALAELPTLSLWPSAANFLFLQTKSEAETAELSRSLKQQGTYVRFTGGGLRITIGCPQENSRTLAHIQDYYL